MRHSERAIKRMEIAVFIRDGGTVKEAEMAFNVKGSHVRACCRENNVNIPGKPRGAFGAYRVIAALLNTEKSLTEIAEECNTTKQNISQIYLKCLENGIVMKERKQGPK